MSAEKITSPDNSIFRDINFLLLSLAFRLVLLQMEAKILLIDGGNNNVTDAILFDVHFLANGSSDQGWLNLKLQHCAEDCN